MVKVDVFYDLLRYTEIREFSFLNFETVLSQLGGIVGLWLGFSIYTVVDAIDKLWKWYERRKQQMTQQNIEMLDQKVANQVAPPFQKFDKMPICTGELKSRRNTTSYI